MRTLVQLNYTEKSRPTSRTILPSLTILGEIGTEILTKGRYPPQMRLRHAVGTGLHHLLQAICCHGKIPMSVDCVRLSQCQPCCAVMVINSRGRYSVSY